MPGVWSGVQVLQGLRAGADSVRAGDGRHDDATTTLHPTAAVADLGHHGHGHTPHGVPL